MSGEVCTEDLRLITAHYSRISKIKKTNSAPAFELQAVLLKTFLDLGLSKTIRLAAGFVKAIFGRFDFGAY